jgi:glucose-6-phosphate isomerase
VFFTVGQHAESLRIPDSIASNPAYSHLANKTLSELLKAEREATEVSLHLHGVPSCRFEMAEINPYNMGYLLTVLEKTVCILGRLLNVNAFDQPGVEESKLYAHAMLGKAGKQYDLLRAEVAKLAGDD